MKNQSRIFFPFPNGTGIMYNLLGIADAPNALAKISREIPCRTLYVECIPVENWLKRPQKFVQTFQNYWRPLRGNLLVKKIHTIYVNMEEWMSVMMITNVHIC